MDKELQDAQSLALKSLTNMLDATIKFKKHVDVDYPEYTKDFEELIEYLEDAIAIYANNPSSDIFQEAVYKVLDLNTKITQS